MRYLASFLLALQIAVALPDAPQPKAKPWQVSVGIAERYSYKSETWALNPSGGIEYRFSHRLHVGVNVSRFSVNAGVNYRIWEF